MNAAGTTTRRFLVVLAMVFFLGTLANAYFLFRPPHYTPRSFNPRSAWDWCVFLGNTLFILYFYFILKRVPNLYARIYWLALLAVFTAGFVEKYFIRFSALGSQLFATCGCAVICVLSLMFLSLHRTYRFNLFAGLTYRLKKNPRRENQ